MNVKVSIVIPVYNVSEYLVECLESVKKQTLKEIEIICVNDASTDNSLEILEEYAKKDSRIIVVNNLTNKGLAMTRNVGADYANGKYLYFLDSDDILALDAIERCYDNAEENNADIVIFDMNTFADNQFVKEQHTDLLNAYKRNKAYNGVWRGCDLFNVLMQDGNYIGNVTVHFFNRSYYDSHNLKFLNGILYEDLPVTLEAFVGAERVTHIAEQLYFRRVRSESIMTTSKTFQHAYGLWKNYLLLNDILKNYSLPIPTEKQIVNILCGRLIRCRAMYKELDEEEALQYMSLAYYERELFKFLVVRYVDLEKENKTITHSNNLVRNELKRINDKNKTLVEENLSLKQKQLSYLNHIERIENDLSNARRNLNSVKNGLSFRIGRIITYIPRMIRNWYNKKKI